VALINASFEHLLDASRIHGASGRTWSVTFWSEMQKSGRIPH